MSEIEAQTKIRAKYLRALENEEWGLLPGPTFVKSFLRTYAQALGLDGKALVEEYRLSEEHPSEGMLEPIVSARQRSRAGPRRASPSRPSRGYTLAVAVIVVVICRPDRPAGDQQHGANTPRADNDAHEDEQASHGTQAPPVGHTSPANERRDADPDADGAGLRLPDRRQTGAS